MKAIILAAGQGTRLRPLTDQKPKCLVELCQTSLLERQIRVLRQAGIEDVLIVGGYRAEAIEALGYPVIRNRKYQSSNMVASLFCASAELTGDWDIIIAYGDIVYELRVLKNLMDCAEPIALSIDSQWRKYWQLRLEDPLTDAETLMLDEDGYVVELGKTPKNYDTIQGQYMGLIKVRADFVPRLKDVYEQMPMDILYDGKDYNNMYMTSFLQHLIDIGWKVKAVPTDNGWLEIDSVDDLDLYHSMQAHGELDVFCKLEG